MSDRPTATLDLAVIGNCTIAALIDRRARVVFGCFPRLDGDPVFNWLVNSPKGQDEADESGLWDVEVEGFTRSDQAYLRNTAILRTVLYDDRGQAVEVVDHCPRFPHYHRIHKPTAIVRTIRPLAGNPRIRVRCRPTFGYGSQRPRVTTGSNHLRFVGGDQTLRMTTDAPLTYVQQETWFVLDGPLHFLLGADEPLTASLPETVARYQRETAAMWEDYVRSLSIPFEFQDAVIRAAITLKMCAFEETGAILAALTTSVPEAADTSRNWDYRYCWMRDSYFVVHCLNRLGQTETMEKYLEYITNVSERTPDGYLKPLYPLTLDGHLEEVEADSLAGYRGMGPVRYGNGAHDQVQNDSYGAVILASAQSFFDKRLGRPGDRHLFERLERLGEQAIARWNTPDAGLWELRTRERVHTFSAVMCWAACDRLAKIAKRLGLGERARRWRQAARQMKDTILQQGFDTAQNSFVESFGGSDLDASSLLFADLGLISADDPKFRGTVAAVERKLKHGDFLFRYHAADDFGEPETSFTICTFWYVDALAATGRKTEARQLFERLLAKRNSVGLLSEDMDIQTAELWGNFPQTYSMVGLINCALRLSKSWGEAF